MAFTAQSESVARREKCHLAKEPKPVRSKNRPPLPRNKPTLTRPHHLTPTASGWRSGCSPTLLHYGSISAISGTLSLSFQSAFHLSLTVLVRYRSPTDIYL